MDRRDFFHKSFGGIEYQGRT